MVRNQNINYFLKKKKYLPIITAILRNVVYTAYCVVAKRPILSTRTEIYIFIIKWALEYARLVLFL